MFRTSRVLTGLVLTTLLAAQPAVAADKEPAYTPAAGAELVATLESLTAHNTGATPLDAEQIKSAIESVKKNAPFIGHDEKTIRAAFEAVRSYDKANGPLWVSGKVIPRNAKDGGPAQDIHLATFNVMQAIEDHVFTPENLKQHEKLLDGFSFASAANFPGWVDPPADPTATYTVKVDASYVNKFAHTVFHQERPAVRPTGAYLAPGSIATVTVPESIVNKGYTIRVGAHSWDFAQKPRAVRLDRVSKVYPIDAKQIKVANPLGGGIYLQVPLAEDQGVIDISIQNSVRSPLFRSLPYAKTTNEEWKNVERNHKAPWADLQSTGFQTQVPTSWISDLDDPTQLMADWDKAMAVCAKLMGVPEGWGREVAYMQVDLMIRGKAFHPGYPMGNDRVEQANRYLIKGPQYSPDYPLHELGHGFTFTKYPGDREAAVNFPYVAVLNRAFGVDLEQAFRGSRGMNNDFITVDNTAIEWMMSDNFLTGNMTGVERQYQPKGHAKYVDVVRLFGWDALDNLWGSIAADKEKGIEWPVDEGNTDRLTLQFSKAAGADLRPLMAFWGIPVQDDAASDAAIKNAGVPASAKVFDQLEHYKRLVPADNKTFRTFSEKWWGRQPKADGFTTERNHAARWDAYNEAEAAKVRDRVQAIITRFFPEGRPKN